ncbi:kinase-like domain-containing protein [Rhizoctonia solani]|nr:kinase-like domain-containing protein [Rhizoctonia solani]
MLPSRTNFSLAQSEGSPRLVPFMSKAGRSGIAFFQRRVHLVTHLMRLIFLQHTGITSCLALASTFPGFSTIHTLKRPNRSSNSSNPPPATPQTDPSPEPLLLIPEDTSPKECPAINSPSSEATNSTMSGSQIVAVLHNPEVPDVTSGLKESGSSPVSLGSSGYLYHALNADGEVAIRTIRMFLSFNRQNERLLKTAADELSVWRRLRHENIVPLLGVACFQEQPALVFPWVGSGNLADFRRKRPTFDKLKMCTQVSRAIAYLHEAGVVHGDIKAQNVLVSDDGSAKLTGFGHSILRELAMHYRDGNDFSTLSIRWTAPEVLEGASSKSPEVDVYALGMTILEIITGRVPFHEISSDQQVVLKVLAHTAPSRPEELASDSRIWTLLTKCWSDDPTARPTAQEVFSTLEIIT